MTTILGLQGDGWTVIGTDSRVCSVDETGMAYQQSTLATNQSKVASNGRYIIGAAGDVRAINILQHAFQPPTPNASFKGRRLDQFVTTKFIPALRQCFEDQGYANERKQKAEHDSSIIISINSVIYVIESDYSWSTDATGLYAIGTGSSYALGAASAIRTKQPATVQQAKTIVLKALRITATFDPHTGAPIQTFTQQRNT